MKNALLKISDELLIGSVIPDKDLLADVKGLTYTVIDEGKEKEEKKVKEKYEKIMINSLLMNLILN